MKNNYLLLLLISFFATVPVFSEQILVTDQNSYGTWYNAYYIDTETETAIYRYDNPTASGTGTTVPETFKYNNVTYTIVEIGSQAFRGEYLGKPAHFSIPKTITKVGYYIFLKSNQQVEYLKCYAVTPPALEDNAFITSNYKSSTLYVPMQSIKLYKVADQWKDWGTILPIDYTSSYSFCVDGIYYGIDDETNKTVKVTYFGYNSTDDNAWSDYEGEINIPSTVTYNGVTYTVARIGNYAFDNSSPTKVTIADGATKLGKYSYRNCDELTTISIPSTIQSIGQECFDGCTSLNSFTSNAITPPSLDEDVFKGVDCQHGILYVPEESVDEYKAADGWKNWGTIVPIGYEPPQDVSLIDGEAYTNNIDRECTSLTYTRTFAYANVWNALYVPISIDVANNISRFDIAEIFAVCPYKDTNNDGVIDASDDNFLVVNRKLSGLTNPNLPYLIRPKNTGECVIPSADNVLYKAETNKVICSTTTDTYTFTGLNSPTSVSGSTTYYMAYDGTMDSSPTTAVTIKPNRWIMDIKHNNYGYISSSSSKSFNVVVIGEDIDMSTVIKMTNIYKSADSIIYTIDGKKVNSHNILPSGAYIKGGKKYNVK